MEETLALLKEYTNHNHIRLTSSGNKAILAALNIAKKQGCKTVLIPDQGGWLTYRDFTKKLNMEIKEIRTDYSLLDLEDLKNKIDENSCLLYSNPAGYFANQDIEGIYKICKDKCLVILDCACLCDGNYADIMVGSFGEWKIVNLGYGGFISSNKKLELEDDFDENKLAGLNEKLKNLRSRLDFLYNKCDQIKKDLKSFEIIHKNKKGIVVVVKFNNDKEFKDLKDYCERNNLEFTKCPRYIRVNEDAISIEVKRL